MPESIDLCEDKGSASCLEYAKPICECGLKDVYLETYLEFLMHSVNSSTKQFNLLFDSVDPTQVPSFLDKILLLLRDENLASVENVP